MFTVECTCRQSCTPSIGQVEARNKELFIRVVQENNGKLPSTRRKSHFDWMREHEIIEAEQVVIQAFDNKTLIQLPSAIINAKTL